MEASGVFEHKYICDTLFSIQLTLYLLLLFSYPAIAKAGAAPPS